MDDNLEIKTLFSSCLNKWGIQISEEQIVKFEKYFKALISWNEKINLTTIVLEKDVYIKHFLDSVSCCQFIDPNGKRIIDIGTGGGFPGLPIKIIFPNCKMMFLDSSTKKINTLKQICSEINVSGCEFITNNVENIGKDKVYRESFDLSLSRAVTALSTLIEYSIPLLKIDGLSIIYKGPNVEKEVDNSVSSLKALNAKIKETHDFILPFTDERRKILIVEKIDKTDDKYPRRVGIPKKRPL